MKTKIFLCALLIYSVCTRSYATDFESCLARYVVSASPETTVAELHIQCQEITSSITDEIDTATEERLLSEQAVAQNEFSLLQHRQNYVLPLAYNFKSEAIEPLNVPGEARELDPTEFKFQLSFKSLLWDKPFGRRAGLYAAYTNTSWWQAYNKDESSPFRETNHQPELFLDIPADLAFGNWELANTRFGVSHQSNGRSGEFSRTWNRVFAEFVISNDANEIRLSPWITISDTEDNPNIEDFRGRMQLTGTHLLGDHTLRWNARHSLDSESRGAVELDWSFPIRGRDDMQFFIQYFEGYGESLIDYNIEARRLGLGVKLGDW